MNIFTFLLMGLLAFSYGSENDTKKDNPFTNTIKTVPDHAQWDILLAKYVDADGNVDYRNFGDDIDSLNAYLDHLGQNSPTNSWTKVERLAYYINLYNAATIQLIINNYPLQSIKDIKNPWGKKRISIGTKLLSLGDIEHQILRKMDEPRIHFAINCASYSCPKLLNKAYTPSTLEKQLQQMTIDFVNDKKRNRISANKVQVSEIFKWYKKDFTKNGTLTDYINKYSKTAVGPNTKIEYLTYDWSLNETK